MRRKIILSCQNGVISGIRTDLRKPAEIRELLKKERSRFYPDTRESLHLDYLVTGEDSLLAVFFPGAFFLKEPGTRRRPRYQVCLPPPGQSRCVGHRDGSREIYSRGKDGFCSVTIESKSECTRELPPAPGPGDIFDIFKPSFFMERTKDSLKFQKIILVSVLPVMLFLPWVPSIQLSRRLAESKEIYRELQIKKPEVPQPGEEYADLALRAAFLAGLLSPDIPGFISALARSSRAPGGVEKLILDENRFRITLWTENPDEFLRELKKQPGISGLEYTGGTPVENFSSLSVAGVYDE